MSTDLGKLHRIDLPREPRQGIRSSIVKMKVLDQELIPRLAEQCIEAGAAYLPGESFYEWLCKTECMTGERYCAGPARQVFCFMRDESHAPFPVYPRGSEGEDLAGPHAGAQTDEEGEGYFATLGPWPFPRSIPEVTQEALNLDHGYAPGTRWVVTGSAEAAKGAIPAPLPLVASDREDVAEKVDVALNAPLGDGFKALITPFGQVVAADLTELASGYPWKLAEESVDALGLEGSALLPDADLVPVADKSLGERLTGYRPTLHRQNFGLLRGGPEVAGALGFEGARLANSVPRDLEFPPVLDPSDVRHKRNGRRNPDGRK